MKGKDEVKKNGKEGRKVRLKIRKRENEKEKLNGKKEEV